jgi:hypothetical protein
MTPLNSVIMAFILMFLVLDTFCPCPTDRGELLYPNCEDEEEF